MIITCTNCTTRLQLDDAKVPTRPFTVRCPKCQYIINAEPEAATPHGEGSALAAGGDLPATTRSQRVPAPPFHLTPEETPEAEVAPAAAGGRGTAELARLLASVLAGGEGAAKTSAGRSRPAWDTRRALICVSDPHRSEIAEGLAREPYEVFVAANTAQALERMREERIDVVVLDPEFDFTEQGAAFITRELNSLRPAERRRKIVVQFSPSARTEDAHAAFLANVNLVVNASDVRGLPRALERTLRDHNELYKDLNRALGVSDI